MHHRFQNEVGLEMGRRVAARLRENPGLLQVARDILTRWMRRNAAVPSLIHCYREWESILQRPLEDICSILESENEEAQRLRQILPLWVSFRSRKFGRSKAASAIGMQRAQLEHIIRAAAGITGAPEFIVIGSQAVLGQFPVVPRVGSPPQQSTR